MEVSPSIKFATELTARDVDRVVRSSRLYHRSGWSPRAVTLDMSAVEYAEYVATARLLVFIEGATRHGAELKLIPPALTFNKGELRFLAQPPSNVPATIQQREQAKIRRRVIARRKVSQFLKHIGFFAAAQLPHLTVIGHRPIWMQVDQVAEQDGVSVVPDVPPPSGSGRPSLYGLDHPDEYPAILPFLWLDQHGASEWETRMIRFLYEHGVVLRRGDADSIVTTVLRELVENVGRHATDDAACAPGALVGALTLARAAYAYRCNTRTLYDSDRAFNDWLADRQSMFVRLVVADSGAGIPRTIADDYARRQRGGVIQGRLGVARTEHNANLILYSFEPTASRYDSDRPQGLGLAAVRRFARGYSGRVAIRSANAIAGYWYPQTASKELSDSRLAYVPGTVVEVDLELTAAAQRNIEHSVTGDVESAQVVLRRWKIEPPDEGLPGAVVAAARESHAPHPVVTLIANGWPRSRRAATDFALAVRRAARAVQGEGALSVIIPEASQMDVASTFQTLDEIDEADAVRTRAWDLSQWAPPVLVLPADGKATWTGGSATLRRLFYALLQGEQVSLGATMREFNLEAGERDYVKAERDWLGVTSDGDLKLRVGPTMLEGAAANNIESTLAGFLQLS